MTIATVLNSEAGLTLIGTILGGIWTLFKSSEWYRKRNDRRYRRALDALEVGVDNTYQTYVRAIKQSREDGKLTGDEIRRARELARQAAIEVGRTDGVNIVRALGEAHLDRLISKLVKRVKRM